MNPKQYLTKIITYRRALRRIEMHIEELYESASGVRAITYDKDKVQSSPENRIEKVMAEIDSEKRQWDKLHAKYERELRKRVDMIARLDHADHVEILMLRYVETDVSGHVLTFRRIADRMHISEDRAKHLHGEALQAFGRRYKS